MKAMKILFALALAACLLAGCSVRFEPTNTGESTAQPTTSAESESAADPAAIVTPVTDAPITDAPSTDALTTGAPAARDELLNFALLDKLFSMTYADYCREEGRTVEPEDYYEGSVYCKFSKYRDATFFFDFDWDSEAPKVKGAASMPGAIVFIPADILVSRQSLTLGELKQWLGRNGTAYSVSEYDGISCSFAEGKYEIYALLDSENDSAVVSRFQVYCKSNFTN